VSKQQYVNSIFKDVTWDFSKESALAYAPSNIALSKYWGKRNKELNLPLTDSVSISLDMLGASTSVRMSKDNTDTIILNENQVDPAHDFHKRAVNFLELFRPGDDFYFHVDTTSTIPVGAGLASSACGFAALSMALNDLFSWDLSLRDLSKIARLGSGSAARSLWHGFVQWHAGTDLLGHDCYAEPVGIDWPELCVGIILVDATEKKISSTDAMNTTVKTSSLYKTWPDVCKRTNSGILAAIKSKNFADLTSLSEESASLMHATMLDAEPPINYSQMKTQQIIEQVKLLRADNVKILYTQDAGPNIKVLFLENEESQLKELFSNITIVKPFNR